MVTISTDTTGCPAKGRSTKRSTTSATNEMPAKPNTSDNHKGIFNQLCPVYTK